ncbi:trehalose-phosphatase [Frigidibacter albus]|uniref:Trehalose 6-phosphate phosphatase n=1 Tax=Frigidibacter albus TaxID=1465486 RepID=A0A6L8VHL1_9RHOB|nr:trehalose-phosphatase [Frigidibacter albus]MZQ89584.1 trehalose-phosphatase [Frigidibacter albus]NBE31490.1 trehalose-phosphatase [Frigidibacter albus]GGH55207.1 trehalose 6-phosphate phosphatase [Frigidibacter albus]
MTTDTLNTAPPALVPEEDAIFLDFDGTLVDIALRPDAVQVPEGLAEMLMDLHAMCGGALALVSGRAMGELAGFLPRFTGPLIGSHGAESRGLDLPGASHSVDLAALHARFAEFAAANGLLAEPKPHGAAIHFRSRPEAEAMARAFASEMISLHPGLTLQPAKMAFELRPEGATKDTALRLVADAAPFAGRRPVYLGDDTTDEPALIWAQELGGIGVKVGEGASAARWRLASPDAVRAWLAAATET